MSPSEFTSVDDEIDKRQGGQSQMTQIDNEQLNKHLKNISLLSSLPHKIAAVIRSSRAGSGSHHNSARSEGWLRWRMPRDPRLVIPGALHHIMVAGNRSTKHLSLACPSKQPAVPAGKGVLGSDLRIYAWALMSNHFHLRLRSGSEGLSTTMRRLLTGYAVRFNRRHRRWDKFTRQCGRAVWTEK